MDNALRLENRHTGEILRLRRVAGADGQIVLEIESSLPRRAAGPPLHVHLVQLEEGVVKAGTLGARVGNQKFVVPAGGQASFPAGVVHTWWNAGEELLELSGRAVPAGDLDRYLQALFAVVAASNSGRPDPFHMTHVLWRHRHTQALVVPPRPAQRVLFPVILLVGRLLGKYRGSDWPGSPESCPGAPEPE